MNNIVPRQENGNGQVNGRGVRRRKNAYVEAQRATLDAKEARRMATAAAANGSAVECARGRSG